jgi:hypothetical protein
MNIIDIQKAATAEADKLLRASQNLINDVKTMLQRGSDTLTQGQVEEWLLVIPVMISELAPIRDAYELTRKLVTIDSEQIQARTLLDTTEKGGRREAIITINTKEREIDKSIMYYIRDRAGNMIDALHSLLMSLMKIWNGKASQPKES